MRVLFTTFPWESHYFPIVPVQWATRAAGHEVRVATMAPLIDTVVRSGLPAVRVGPELEDIRKLGGGKSHLDGLNPAGWPADWPVHPERLDEQQRHFQEHLGVMQCTVAEAMLPDLIALGRKWRPDLIVSDAVTLAGPVAAAVLGVPNVRYQWGIPYLQRIEMKLDRSGPLPEYARLYERFGGELRTEPDAWLDPCPPSLRYPSVTGVTQMRYVPYNGAGATPDWLLDPPPAPRVCLTWGGTTAKGLGPAMLDSVRQVLDAVRGLDVEIVVAAGKLLRDMLGDELPDGVRLVSVPLDLLLPTCTAVVHHGGPGTTLTAASWGIPQLLITRIPQLTIVASRLAAAKAGRYLPQSEVPEGTDGAALIRDEVQSLLSDPSYRTAADALRAEIAEQPAPAAIVTELERLA
ncbi:MAG: hypothetical protein AUI14_19620 [Actinobacteria bacterium 13_2_20CM_2_71_6]|nr:MAG: hypothetical protein AUI14_19620 [Actinobacteria bacterium 13_2_20CM_2_71_6]